MIREFCDGCTIELQSGENRVSSRIAGKVLINDTVVEIEVQIGMEYEPQKPDKRGMRTVTWNHGHLCNICALRAVLFAAGFPDASKFVAPQNPTVKALPNWIRTRKHGDEVTT